MTYHIIRLDWDNRKDMSEELNQRVRELTTLNWKDEAAGVEGTSYLPYRVVAMNSDSEEMNVLLEVG